MKTNITNTVLRTLLLIIVVSTLSLLFVFSCTGKSNSEDDTFKQSTDKDLGMDTASGNTSTGDSKMAR